MTAVAVPKHPLINGKPIRNRLLQQVLWSVALGTIVFGLFASGQYFGWTQVHWYIHIGPLYWAGFWWKPAWDGGMGVVGPHTWLINLTNWSTYRHNYRNIGLPALAAMGALSIYGGARKPGSRLYTAVAPLLVLITAVVLITVASWIELMTVAHLTLHGKAVGWVHLAEALVFGFLIGKVLHYLWRPAGTRIQHFLAERAIDRHFRAGRAGLPWWVEHNVAPPTLRETAASIASGDESSGEADSLRSDGHSAKSTAIYVLAGAVCLIVLGVDFVGFIGHIWVGVLGHTFPYLAP